MLVLNGVPVDNTDPVAWCESNRPRITSYVLRTLAKKWTVATSGRSSAEYSSCRHSIERLNEKFIEAFVAETPRDSDLLFVILYSHQYVKRDSWRESFVKQTLRSLGARFLDTKPILYAQATDRELSVSQFYLPDGHLNETGNAIVAKAVADALLWSGTGR